LKQAGDSRVKTLGLMTAWPTRSKRRTRYLFDWRLQDRLQRDFVCIVACLPVSLICESVFQ
jgi:hypothetical protein